MLFLFRESMGCAALMGALYMLFAIVNIDASCVDDRPTGYYVSKVFNNGLPPINKKTYITLPTTISSCDLESLHQYCVDRINMYRNATLKFTGGTKDPRVPILPLGIYSQNDKCANAMSLGDLYTNNG